MLTLNQNNLNFLVDNGFELKRYEEQGLSFYTKEIKDSHSLKKLITHHYEIQEDEEINTKGTSFIMEIQTTGENPQWLFTGEYEKLGILQDQNQFIEFVKKIEKVITIS
ncbi:hypothetical protein OB894_12180 [Bacillus subtilis]|uniref:hypothetical protein n=1 Tax=Bacillus TaxID=1386 RepID=UPI00022D8A18|nr:hypothetical protein [Bacillus subtilis]UOX38150.1 hypothetical protein [Bacillus phage BUCT083]WIT28218.1 hypothetical protein [Bacillus phage SPbetaL8]AOL97940.1 hypothetical protein BS16045_02223 [Bacillus subtilis]EHA30594.1 hypothetical protein BSSC8_21790 [Bacillus subtilis subsp. subtilis str. SC-8]MDD9765684.1 hypothetical protein [Bacillus subtilis]